MGPRHSANEPVLIDSNPTGLHNVTRLFRVGQRCLYVLGRGNALVFRENSVRCYCRQVFSAESECPHRFGPSDFCHL